jgi:hypothetical protein
VCCRWSDEGLRNNDDGNHHAGVSGSETRGDRLPNMGRLDLTRQNNRGFGCGCWVFGENNCKAL